MHLAAKNWQIIPPITGVSRAERVFAVTFTQSDERPRS